MKKKRHLFATRLIVSLFAMLTASTAWADGSWTSGDCTVTLEGTTLTVSGSGAMADYESTSNRGWNSSVSSITSIVINEGVTSIGKYAFYGCKNVSMTSVTLPSSLTSIGNSAFGDCRYMTSCNIPSGVTTIGGRAFYQCENLESISIPASVTSIGGSAFYSCHSADISFAVGSQLTTIGAQAFAFCKSPFLRA